VPPKGVNELKDSLFITKEFFDAKKLRTLEGANQNSSPDKLGSWDSDLLGRKEVRPPFLAEIPKVLNKLSFKS